MKHVPRHACLFCLPAKKYGNNWLGGINTDTMGGGASAGPAVGHCPGYGGGPSDRLGTGVEWMSWHRLFLLYQTKGGVRFGAVFWHFSLSPSRRERPKREWRIDFSVCRIIKREKWVEPWAVTWFVTWSSSSFNSFSLTRRSLGSLFLRPLGMRFFFFSFSSSFPIVASVDCCGAAQ